MNLQGTESPSLCPHLRVVPITCKQPLNNTPCAPAFSKLLPVTAIGSAAVASDTRPPSSPLLSTTSQASECTQRLRTQDVSVHEHDAATNTPRGSCPAKDAAPGTHIRQRCRTLFIPRSAAQSLSPSIKDAWAHRNGADLRIRDSLQTRDMVISSLLATCRA